MSAPEVDRQHELLPGLGGRTRIEPGREGTGEFYWALAYLDNVETWDTGVDEGFGTELLGDLNLRR